MQVKLGPQTTNLISKIDKINGWQNRAVYGVAALMSQPFFDRFNPSVDKDTQKSSMTRTIIKICVGAGVGMTARHLFQKWGEKLVQKGVFKSKKLFNEHLSTLKILPKNQAINKKLAVEKPNLNEKKFLDEYKDKYKRAVGNVFSIIGAVSTMVTIDVVLTDKLLSYFNKKMKNKALESKQGNNKGVSFGEENSQQSIQKQNPFKQLEALRQSAKAVQ